MLTENKRKIIFKNDKIFDTEPYILRDGKLN